MIENIVVKSNVWHRVHIRSVCTSQYFTYIYDILSAAILNVVLRVWNGTDTISAPVIGTK